MLVAVISDIHDRCTNLLLALARARDEGCEHLLCLGDIATIATFRLLCEEWTQGLDLVFGNNEWERDSFLRVADEYPHATLHGDCASLTLAGRRLFLCHYPHVALRQAAGGHYDAVFFGHTHRAEMQPATLGGSPLLLNPGDIQGRFGKPSMAIYDTGANSAYFLTP